MENSSKKSIESLKDQEVDGQNVKGGFSLIRNEDSVGHYHVVNFERAMHNALDDARQQGFKHAKLTDQVSGKTTTFTID
jgi:hypothetical protein